jgi:uncharacterized protein (DUF2147 family)
MKRLTRPALIALFLLLPVRSAFAENVGVPGYWKTYDDKTGKLTSIVRIWEQNGKLVGRVVKLFPQPDEDPNPKCDKCSGPLRDKPVLGMVFLWGFVRDNGSNHKWVNGAIVDPDDGSQYHCQLELTDGGKRLEVFGYIRVLFKIGRTQVWLRASQRDLPRQRS